MKVKNRLKERFQSDNSGFTLIELIIVVIIIAILTAIAIPLFNNIQEESRDGSGRGETGGGFSSQVETAPEPAAPAEPVNWNPIIFGFGSLLGVAALGGGGFATYKAATGAKKSRKEKKDLEEAVSARWTAAEIRHRKVMLDYSEYETDIWKALLYPALHNPEVPETSAFLKSMRKADSMKRENDDTVDKTASSNNYLLDEYETAVGDLQHTFEIAKNVAERIKYSTLNDDERKDISSAVSLLKHAEDSANSTEARQSYYEQLAKVVKRLNANSRNSVIPEPTVLFIEEQTRLLLTDGASNESSVLEDLTGHQGRAVLLPETTR